MRSTMSLLGLYNNNPGLFGELELPDGVDRDSIVNNLLAETAEFEVLYPSPLFMQSMIGIWSHKELPVWTKLYETTQYKYNPIQNYDRKEKWSEDENVDKNLDAQTTGTSKTQSEQSGKGHVESEDHAGTDHYTSAYNETDFTPTGKDNSDGQTIRDSTSSYEGDVNVSSSDGTISDEKTKRGLDRSGEIEGSTGFYTKQKMIEQERDIVSFNISNYIIDSFKKRFCLQIY